MVEKAPGEVAGDDSSNASPEEALPRQFGKYTLLRKLAAGGMAELYLALHRSVGGFEKLVVIKRILPQMNHDKAFIEMLVLEARVAATLTHPNVVQTFDVGQVDDTYFIAMEHIEGEDIRTIVRGMRNKNVSEFPLHHAISIVLGTCAGLAYAHEKRGMDGKVLSIVHRDISPQNIVITFSGDVKIVDFGIAKSQHAHEDATAGVLKGKVPYMSPEQAAGEDIDWRSDIFATGVILFELTTGRRLFKGRTELDTLRLIREEEYPLPSMVAPGYPLALERIVMKALAKKREDRYQSAREMQSDLEAYVRNERLPVSTVSLGAWMQMLFAEKIEQLKEALSSVKARADAIAELAANVAEHTSGFAGMTGLFPAIDLASLGTTTSASTGSAVATIPPAKKRSPALLVVAVALGVIAVGGTIFFLTRPPAQNPAATDSAPPPQPTAAAEVRGSLKITSTPPGAAIWIEGDLRKEQTPATIDNLPVGAPIHIKLSADGLESFKSEVTLDKNGDTKTIDAQMKAGSVTAVLNVTPEPSVWLDGKQWKGSSKKVENLSADEEHKIVVSAPGFLPKSFTFTGKQGETKTFDAVLQKGDANALLQAEKEKAEREKAEREKNSSTGSTAPGPTASGPGTIRVNSKGGYCNVTVNGAAAGPTPASVTVPAGQVSVTCRPESGPPQSTSVNVEAGKTAYVSFKLN